MEPDQVERVRVTAWTLLRADFHIGADRIRLHHNHGGHLIMPPSRSRRMSHPRTSVAVIAALAATALVATSNNTARADTTSADLATTINPIGMYVAGRPYRVLSPYYVGKNLGFSITVTNHGPDAAANVVVSDSWTTGSTFQSVTATAPSSVSCAAPPVGSQGTVTCTTSSLAPGASMTIHVTVRYFAFHNQFIQDTATATSATPDPDMTNNTAAVAAVQG